MKIGLLLSGCGVFDGAEIQESVLAMLAIESIGAEYFCIGINKDQHHVVNHLTGEEMPENRNMLIESARIARGSITEISELTVHDFDALVIPGGFGSAKNFTDWAFNGAKGAIDEQVQKLIIDCIQNGKPIAALCVSPIVIAKAVEGTHLTAHLTIGSTGEKSEYSIETFTNGLNDTGATTEMKTVQEILIDKKNKIITAPCYMMDATLSEVNKNISQAVKELIHLVN